MKGQTIFLKSAAFGTINCASRNCREEHAILTLNHKERDEVTIVFPNTESLQEFGKSIAFHVAEYAVHQEL